MNTEKTENFTDVIIPELGVMKTDNFSKLYPVLNSYMYNNAVVETGRDGDVKELLDFKTQITNPYKRCVGGYGRNVNVFFLLAEAMWIALGKKDVKFLTLFNERMADFSDNGVTFHAPYGYRLRHWGVRTEDSFVGDGLNASKGYDQVIDAIRMLGEDPSTRQVVMSVWNPAFDLGYKSKDIPCNDMVMLKVRNGKLITTIQNRSNDLHWGLPTNLFQFSFLTELMSASLGIELGTQTHNSQSLHIYNWNKTAEVMNASYESDETVGDLYENCNAVEKRMDFNFSHTVPVNRFREIEYVMKIITDNINKISVGEKEVKEEVKVLKEFSSYLHYSYQLLKVYIAYKLKLKSASNSKEKDASRFTAVSEIELLEAKYGNHNLDISVLAKNFFVARLSVTSNHGFLGKL